MSIRTPGYVLSMTGAEFAAHSVGKTRALRDHYLQDARIARDLPAQHHLIPSYLRLARIYNRFLVMELRALRLARTRLRAVA